MGLSEDKYNSLRKRLDQLGYRQPLGVPSVALVEKLFADLLHTTDSLKNVKQQALLVQEESQAVIQHGDPYKAENTRLLRENNDLHLQIIKVKEDVDGKVKELKAALRKSEHECADLQFLNSQYAHKLKALQKQDQAKTDRIQQLHERNMNAVVQTPGGRRRHIAPRRPVLEVESPLPGSPLGKENSPPSKQDPYMSDLLRVADAQIAELAREKGALEEAGAAGQRRVETLAKQVALRDKEVDRLQHLLEGGRPTKAIVNDGMKDSTDRVISHLNMQIEYLQQSNREVDAKYRAAMCKQREDMEVTKGLQSRNAELQLALDKIEAEVEGMRQDKQLKFGTYDTELEILVSKMQEKEEKLKETRKECKAVKEKKGKIVEEKKELMKLLSTSQGDAERFVLVVKRLEDDKIELKRLLNNATLERRELQRNIDSIEHMTAIKTTNVEQQSSIATTVVQEELCRLKEEHGELKRVHDVINKELEEMGRDLNLKKEELSYYKQECGNLQSLMAKYAIPARDTDPSPHAARTKEELTVLRSTLSSTTDEVMELQSKVRVLAAERDNISALYEQATHEVRRLRQQEAETIVSEMTSALKSERDNALSKLRQALSERDTCSEQLALQSETSRIKTERLQHELQEAESRLAQATNEKDSLNKRVAGLKDTLKKLEDQVTLSSSSLNTVRAGQTQAESQMCHLRTVASAAQRSRDELHNKLTEVTMELELCQQRNRHLDKQVHDLQDCVKGKNTNTLEMRQTLVDKERSQDDLLSQLDEKTEKIIEMNHKYLQQDKALQALTADINDFEEKMREQRTSLANKKAEIQSLKAQIKNLIEDKEQGSSLLDRTVKQNKQFSKDLALMTDENQRLNSEVDSKSKEVEAMRRNINDYAQRVLSIENIIESKECERNDILHQYHGLSEESEKVAAEAKRSVEDCRDLQRELIATNDVKNALEVQLRHQANEIQTMLGHNESLEQTVSNLELQVAQLDNALVSCEEEKRQIELDLSAVREINNRIEGQREGHARQAVNRSVEVEQLQRVIEGLNTDCESLKRQITAERECVRNLESIIHRGREQEYQTQMTSEQALAKITRFETDLEVRAAEAKEAKTKLKDLSKEYDRLREENKQLTRDVTNERYEREKAKNIASVLRKELLVTSQKDNRSPSKPRTYSDAETPRSTIVENSAVRPISYEPSLSPSSFKKHTRVMSSADETDDSIVHKINRSLKFKSPITTPGLASLALSGSSFSTMTPLLSTQRTTDSVVRSNAAEATLGNTNLGTPYSDISTPKQSELSTTTVSESTTFDSSLDSIAVKVKELSQPSTGMSFNEDPIPSTQPPRLSGTADTETTLDSTPTGPQLTTTGPQLTTTGPAAVRSRPFTSVNMSDATNSDVTFDGDEDDSLYQAIRTSQRPSSK